MTNTLGPSPTVASYCQCGVVMVGLQTSMDSGSTTYVECAGYTTISIITPTATPTPSINPTTTEPVHCWPIHGGNPKDSNDVTDADKLVAIIRPDVKTYCAGTKSDWHANGGDGDSKSPGTINLIEAGFKLISDAPEDC